LRRGDEINANATSLDRISPSLPSSAESKPFAFGISNCLNLSCAAAGAWLVRFHRTKAFCIKHRNFDTLGFDQPETKVHL